MSGEQGGKTVNVGVDLHKTRFTVCVRGGGGDRFEQYPTTDEGYERFLEKAAAWRGTGRQVSGGVESTGWTIKRGMDAGYCLTRGLPEGMPVSVIIPTPDDLRGKVLTRSVGTAPSFHHPGYTFKYTP